MVGLPWIVDADEKACHEVYRHLAEDLDALVVPASGFELPDTFFRVGFGGDQDFLTLGLERLDTARKTLNSDEHKRDGRVMTGTVSGGIPSRVIADI